ncbi:interferon-induced protein 44-like [Ictalurus punctatus]|uniref:Interferon-induced protein 44-like n=1 Tax=Ictalurus punctatus TaxID=7998 RepID=A0A979EQ94_ICTPU|nr:interferon-induced protein 44-like [Ictalurus punctatus]XP_053532207.1 interferon-induced protein 44-like [Ictalurus punctatus]
MGNRLSTPSPSSQVLPEPWRKMDCGREEILHEVKEFKPSTEVLRIMLYGPTGVGKSSFINSVQRVLSGRNAMNALENSTLTGKSFTKKMNIHKLKKGRGEPYPLEIVDIMGIESTDGGVKHEDIIKAFLGHISDEYIDPRDPEKGVSGRRWMDGWIFLLSTTCKISLVVKLVLI